MRKLKYCLYLLIIIFIKCTSIPPINPEDESSSIVGISIQIKRFHTIVKYPNSVYLMKLNENDKPNFRKTYLNNNPLIRSNYSRDGQVYFLNAAPGRYIVIAALETPSERELPGDFIFTTYYLPLEMIQLTDVQLQTGEVAFMGKYIVEVPLNFNYVITNPDEAQHFYCKRLQPNRITPIAGSCLIEGLYSFLNGRGEAAEVVILKEKNKDIKNEIEFWKNAKEHLKGDFSQKNQYKEQQESNEIWQKIIDRRLKKLGVD